MGKMGGGGEYFAEKLLLVWTWTVVSVGHLFVVKTIDYLATGKAMLSETLFGGVAAAGH